MIYFAHGINLRLLGVLHFFVEVISHTCSPGRGEILVRSQGTQPDGESSKSGHFFSPNWPKTFEPGRRCVYRFIAASGEKVHLRFQHFQLGGEMPLCTEDFLDVYIDVASSTLDTDRENAVLSHMASGEPPTTTPFSAAVYSSVLDRSALLGRYCGNYLADSRLQFVSLHREIVLDFYANLESISKQWAYSGYSALGFEGTYEFVSDTTFYPGRALTHAELSSISTERQTAACRFRVDVTSGAQISGRGGGDLSDSLPGVTGELISPTYPGYHPDGLHCAYQLVGLPSQRVNLDILDLDLPEVANVCSSDYLLFYDGLTPDPTTPVIGSRFCGTNKRIRVVSSGPNLLILFVTGTSVSSSTGGQSLVQRQSSTRRGFRLEYTFSAALLPVDPTQESQHIRGTECDYMIQSHGLTEATFEFPTHKKEKPLYPNRVCSFYFLGSVHAQYIEAVRIGFEELQLPKPSISKQNCNHGFLAVYGSRSFNSVYQLSEPRAGPTHAFSEGAVTADHIWCDREDQMRHLMLSADSKHFPIVGRYSVLALKLNSTGSTLPGMYASFRLRYRFERDFGIPGIDLNTGTCQFLYSPSFSPFLRDLNIAQPSPGLTHHQGWTNSPFYLNSYPSNTTCIYFFVPDTTQQPMTRMIRLSFGKFDVQHSRELTIQPTSTVQKAQVCSQNTIEIVTVRTILGLSLMKRLAELSSRPFLLGNGQQTWVDEWEAIENELRHTLTAHDLQLEPLAIECGPRIPGPVITERPMDALLLRFRSSMNTQTKGFTLHYEFISDATTAASSTLSYHTCGTNLSSLERGGLIESPNFPKPYSDNLQCVWTIKADGENSQLLLYAEKFTLDGTELDCSRAVMRIYTADSNQPAVELCGNQSKPTQLIISRNTIAIRFLSTQNTQGATGFRLIWTELLPVEDDGVCPGFFCEHTRHCVSQSLTCNGLHNCGLYEEDGELVIDKSDEMLNCSKGLTYNFLHIGIGVSLTFALLFGLVAFIYCRERKRQKKMPSDPLAELTGSKHSLASSHLGMKHHHHHRHCTNQIKSVSGHSHLAHHHRTSRTNVVADGDVAGLLSGAYVKKHQENNDHRSHYAHSRTNLLHAHSFTSKQHLTSTQDLSKNQTYGSSKLQRKYPRNAPIHTSTLGRVNSNQTGSVHSGVVGTGFLSTSVGGNLPSDTDGGLLIREKMQKISIV